MKITIELDIPKDMDLDRIYEVVTESLYKSDDVSPKEFVFISRMLNKVASMRVIKVGFKEWAETHHEVVTYLEELSTHLDMLPRLLDNVINEDTTSGIYDLGIQLTNDFVNQYEPADWNGEWIETIREFIDFKLK
jgi:hypothetical protein